MRRWLLVCLGTVCLAGGASGTTMQLSGVPSYLWYNGCSPTAGGMVIGYWNTVGLGSLITAGDGTSSWTTNQQAVKAMIASPGHIRDYAPTPDRVATADDPYHPDDSVADFMYTSRDPFAWGQTLENLYGYGLREYSKRQGHASADGAWYGGFSGLWAVLVEEINAGRPVLLAVDSDANGTVDHTVTAIGYDDTPGALRYAAYNTYDHTVHWYSFAAVQSGRAYGVSSGTRFNTALSVVDGVLTVPAGKTLELSAGDGATGAITASLTNLGTVQVSATTHFGGAGATYSHGGTLAVAGGATLTIQQLAVWTAGTIGGAGEVELAGGLTVAGSVSKVGGGTLTVGGPQAHAAGSALNVQEGVLRLDSDAGAGGANLTLNVLGGAVAALGADQRLAGLSIAGDGAGGYAAALDLNDNALRLDYGATPVSLDQVRQMLAGGYNDGAWDGAGIRSSVAGATGLLVGYADGADDVVDGLPPGTILVRYALPGDVNLDDKVDGDDYDWFLGSFGAAEGAVWTMGDFNYDGRVDGDDNDWLVGYFGSTGPISAGSAGEVVGQVVPEPGGLAALSAGAVLAGGWLCRRRGDRGRRAGGKVRETAENAGTNFTGNGF